MAPTLPYSGMAVVQTGSYGERATSPPPPMKIRTHTHRPGALRQEEATSRGEKDRPLFAVRFGSEVLISVDRKRGTPIYVRLRFSLCAFTFVHIHTAAAQHVVTTSMRRVRGRVGTSTRWVRTIRDRACRLRRIYLLRTWVNRKIRSMGDAPPHTAGYRSIRTAAIERSGPWTATDRWCPT